MMIGRIPVMRDHNDDSISLRLIGLEDIVQICRPRHVDAGCGLIQKDESGGSSKASGQIHPL